MLQILTFSYFFMLQILIFSHILCCRFQHFPIYYVADFNIFTFIMLQILAFSHFYMLQILTFLYVADLAFSLLLCCRFSIFTFHLLQILAFSHFVADNGPQCDEPVLLSTVSEDAPVGYPIIVAQAKDFDDFPHDRTRYFLIGDGAGDFSVGEQSGEVVTAKHLDRERRERYDLSVSPKFHLIQPFAAWILFSVDFWSIYQDRLLSFTD